MEAPIMCCHAAPSLVSIAEAPSACRSHTGCDQSGLLRCITAAENLQQTASSCTTLLLPWLLLLLLMRGLLPAKHKLHNCT